MRPCVEACAPAVAGFRRVLADDFLLVLLSHQELIYCSLLGIDYLLGNSNVKRKNEKIKKIPSPTVIFARIDNNTHEIHNATFTCGGGSVKRPPPTHLPKNTHEVRIRRFVWKQSRASPSAPTFRPSIRATQNAPPFLSEGAFNRAFLSYDL